MGRILLILLLVAAAVVFIYKLGEMPRQQRLRLLKWLALILLITLFVGLAATGRLSWLFALIASITPLLPRVVNWLMKVAAPLYSLSGFFKPGGMAGGPTIQTEFFRMVVNLLKGSMDGQVLKGEFQGRRLAELNLEELLRLLTSVAQQDQESAALLAAFLDRYHSGWRQSHGEGPQSQNWQSQAEMSVQEARQILGVSEQATEQDIQTAHRRLIQKLHPDRGGSDYLAAKINHARDCLLKP
ncbi:MAG: DnaJ domain-containing protein [Gammaproteobacteria bacterium]|nr:DnaJ domain-containing protein [Gammaproteobacteria bacterium]